MDSRFDRMIARQTDSQTDKQIEANGQTERPRADRQKDRDQTDRPIHSTNSSLIGRRANRHRIKGRRMDNLDPLEKEVVG